MPWSELKLSIGPNISKAGPILPIAAAEEDIAIVVLFSIKTIKKMAKIILKSQEQKVNFLKNNN